MSTEEIINQIQAIATVEDMERVDALIREQPGQMEPAIQTALVAKLKQITQESAAVRDETITVLRQHGVEYPLTEWLTPKNYADKFGQTVQTVTNWISRGIVPEDHVKEIPELGLRLVKAVEYSPRAYKERESVKDAS